MKTTQSKRSCGRGCLRRLGQGLLILVLLVVILAGVGYVYEGYAAQRDLERYPPPGRWIEVNGHKLHLYCTGTGSPTVILESPANGSSIDWGYVQPEVERFTRVCSYDRAGFGWSELGPAPRTTQHEAEELHALLDAAGESGPYLLVGASYGGHIVRLFAHSYPQEVSGLVLVDPRPEKLTSIPLIQEQSRSSLVALRLITVLGDCGFARLLVAWAPEKMIPASGVPLYNSRPGSYEIVFQAKLWHVSYDEASALETSDAQVLESGPLGDLPLIVIRHGKPMFGTLPVSQADEMEEKWKHFQEEIAAQSTAGQLVVASGSGHLIQGEQPAIIVESIQQLLGQP